MVVFSSTFYWPPVGIGATHCHVSFGGCLLRTPFSAAGWEGFDSQGYILKRFCPLPRVLLPFTWAAPRSGLKQLKREIHPHTAPRTLILTIQVPNSTTLGPAHYTCLSPLSLHISLTPLTPTLPTGPHSPYWSPLFPLTPTFHSDPDFSPDLTYPTGPYSI